MRGTAAIVVVSGAILAAFAFTGGASYALLASEPEGPAGVVEWAARAVRPPGELPSGRGAEVFARHGCALCHTLDGRGGAVGPTLNGLRERKTRAEVVEWLRDPQAAKPGTSMPRFPLSPVERELLADYLLAK